MVAVLDSLHAILRQCLCKRQPGAGHRQRSVNRILTRNGGQQKALGIRHAWAVLRRQ